MNLDFLTPEFFDTLIWITIILGLALAAVRLYDDLTRPLPPEEPPYDPDDTPPHPIQTPDSLGE
jgi:hypothetical protein